METPVKDKKRPAKRIHGAEMMRVKRGVTYFFFISVAACFFPVISLYISVKIRS